MIVLTDPRKEVYLKIQPFASQKIYIKRRGDRYILVGNTKAYADKLERKGFRFNTEIRAWLMPHRKTNVYIYTIIGEALGIAVDMRKYKHLIGTERKRKIGDMKPDQSVATMYLSELQDMIKHIKEKINTRIIPILKRTENQYKIGGTGEAGYLQEFTNMIEQIRKEYNFENAGKILSERIVKKANNINRQKFIDLIKKSSGLDLSTQI